MGNNNLIGVRQLQSAFDRIGRAPAKVLTKATKTAANMVKNKAKQDAKSKEKGYATGQMIRGIKIKRKKNYSILKKMKLGVNLEVLIIIVQQVIIYQLIDISRMIIMEIF